jgi:hypothetical protein
VDRFAVREKHHPQEAILGFGDQHPAANAPVSLYGLFHRGPDCAFYPLVADGRSIGTVPERIKVESGLHFANVSETVDVVAA